MLTPRGTTTTTTTYHLIDHPSEHVYPAARQTIANTSSARRACSPIGSTSVFQTLPGGIILPPVGPHSLIIPQSPTPPLPTFPPSAAHTVIHAYRGKSYHGTGRICIYGHLLSRQSLASCIVSNEVEGTVGADGRHRCRAQRTTRRVLVIGTEAFGHFA